MSAPSSGGKHFLATLFFVSLLLVPQIWFWKIGFHAMRSEHYLVDAGYDFVYSIDGMRQVGFRTQEYYGPEAVRMGAGMAALGAMLSVWTLALLLYGRTGWFWIRKVLAGLSFLLLAAGITLHFPPWKSGMDPIIGGLWAFLVGIGSVGSVSRTFGRRLSGEKGGRLQTLSVVVLVGVLVASLLFFGAGALMGLAIAAFVLLGFWAHVAVLWPSPRSKAAL